MSNGITGIDHILIGVRDLDAARMSFARLGFNTSPLGRHQGWGTANYCIMFENDYLELLGIVDDSLFTNNLDQFLEKREGLLGVALAVEDASACEASWRSSGLTTATKGKLSRLLETPGNTVELHFENVMIDPSERAGLNIFACRHLTPEPMRRPAWLVHPNTATAIRSCTLIAHDLDPLAEQCGRLFGSTALVRTDRLYTVHTGSATLLLATPKDAEDLHPAFEFPTSVDGLMVLEITVADLQRAASFLDLQGIQYDGVSGGTIHIQPDHACGVMLELTQTG